MKVFSSNNVGSNLSNRRMTRTLWVLFFVMLSSNRQTWVVEHPKCEHWQSPRFSFSRPIKIQTCLPVSHCTCNFMTPRAFELFYSYHFFTFQQKIPEEIQAVIFPLCPFQHDNHRSGEKMNVKKTTDH